MLNAFIYNSWIGHIISAGVTSLVLFGKMNVSEAHLDEEDRNVLGNQVWLWFLTIQNNIDLALSIKEYESYGSVIIFLIYM